MYTIVYTETTEGKPQTKMILHQGNATHNK